MAKSPLSAKPVLIEVVERLTGRVVARHGPYRAVLATRIERAILKDLNPDRCYTRQVENEVVR